jgi:DNA-binding transcriptional ArsR family regulator
MTRQAVTKHLRVMEHAGLVRSSRQGRENIWRLEDRRLKDAQRYLKLILAG